MVTRREVEVVLTENGLSTVPTGMHSWRCEHPDRYGDCTCFDELVDDLMSLFERPTV